MTEEEYDEPDALEPNELMYLLTLATANRKKRARQLETMSPRPGQTRDEFHAARGKQEQRVAWATSVEDHLIELVAETDAATMLRSHHQERLEVLSS